MKKLKMAMFSVDPDVSWIQGYKLDELYAFWGCQAPNQTRIKVQLKRESTSTRYLEEKGCNILW